VFNLHDEGSFAKVVSGEGRFTIIEEEEE